jgi:peptidoglycan/xylan/chitin deacetylase (PgdA/CDA1 family)
VKGKLWLTIDDSPSPETGALTDMLLRHDAPALLFCRGDRLAQFPDAAAEAVAKGFVLGNHAYNHRRAGQIGFDAMTEEIRATEKLIELAYTKAERARPGKYFRFPHMDRGAGGWVIDYDAAPPQHRETLIRLFADGLNIDLTLPGEEQRILKAALQDWLRGEGFAAPPCTGVTHNWFVESEMAQAVDAMFTFSTSDWMITPRHQGKWPYKTLDDLTRKIDDDPWLAATDSANIVLTHDQEGMLPVTEALVRHFRKAYSFLAFS